VEAQLQDIQIGGYFPGVVGKITELHAVYYFENWGFDVTFETQVGAELSEFVRRFDDTRDGLWTAARDGEFAGAIAIDGLNAEAEGARLRWFIVPPRFQKQGIGRKLIRQAIHFCRKSGYSKIYLWTFKGLEDARRIYESHDFCLCGENEVAQWGRRIREQKYVLELTGS
jgi:GNAT superfamily N-acetyltransferase